jgi:hypothetical protein
MARLLRTACGGRRPAHLAPAELENMLDAILEVFVVAISGGKLVDGANVCGAAAIACAKPFHRKDGRRNLARPCDPGAQ